MPGCAVTNPYNHATLWVKTYNAFDHYSQSIITCATHLTHFSILAVQHSTGAWFSDRLSTSKWQRVGGREEEEEGRKGRGGGSEEDG